MDNIEKTKPAIGESNYDARSDRSLLYQTIKVISATNHFCMLPCSGNKKNKNIKNVTRCRGSRSAKSIETR